MPTLSHYFRRSPAPLRILGFLLAVAAIAAPLAIPLYRLEYERTDGRSVIWAPALIYLIFTLGLFWWGRQGHRLASPAATLGFTGGRRWWQAWGMAFMLGSLGVAALYGLQVGCGWARLAPWPGDLLTVAIAGAGVAFGVGLAEELLFRGWLLFELERDYGALAALWLNGLLFAVAHFLRPLSVILATWPQFLGLLLLGLTLVWARRSPLPGTASKTALGFPVGLHGGLIWGYYLVDVGDLIVPTGAVPSWVTGVDGNPLAGCLGIGLLGAIALGFYRLSRSPRPPSEELTSH